MGLTVKSVQSNDDFQYELFEREQGTLEVRVMKCLTKNGSVSVPDLIDGFPVTSIGDMAFQACKAKNITLPDSLIEIGRGAFQQCRKLTRIEIPNHVQVIRADAFSGCTSLQQVLLPDSLREIGSVDRSRGALSTGGAFENCARLTEIAIPDSVVMISRKTFKGCNNLKIRSMPRHIIWI